MSDTLDDRLAIETRRLIVKAQEEALTNTEVPNLVEDHVARIQQAFADAGYLKHPVSMDNLLQDKSLMTGQEAFERLMKELEPDDFEDGMDYDLSLQAAKRAFGINDKENN
jgi:hypothetical protein